MSDRNTIYHLPFIILDLSAAFDTIDHNNLINHLENWVGLFQCTLNWFQTYITGRQFYINLGYYVRKICSYAKIAFGVALGSCLGSLLFSLYMFPLGHVIREHKVNVHSCADDTQICIAFEANDPHALCSLTTCLSAINQRMSNQSQRDALLNRSGNLALGVILDSNLNLKPHINKVTKKTLPR